MMRALSKDKPKNVCFVLQRGFGLREIERVLNATVGSVYNVRKNIFLI